ncbi:MULTISPECIES: hypothetical protein [Roseateles]|uniref:Periplasmic heavy metal sensor n=1 Tax=Pelomonas caseinilytica TaxID=2906763 RepID=A0ABS8X9G7_9BURK|nr:MULTISPECIES: hypothetical protein [unclassified Roseateles]MCE4536243.1 hypothetical protein [Pelomonas sp. P7]HEV6967703.1 hypothetical protein [Roseateles sp.]
MPRAPLPSPATLPDPRDAGPAPSVSVPEAEAGGCLTGTTAVLLVAGSAVGLAIAQALFGAGLIGPLAAGACGSPSTQPSAAGSAFQARSRPALMAELDLLQLRVQLARNGLERDEALLQRGLASASQVAQRRQDLLELLAREREAESRLLAWPAEPAPPVSGPAPESEHGPARTAQRPPPHPRSGDPS